MKAEDKRKTKSQRSHFFCFHSKMYTQYKQVRRRKQHNMLKEEHSDAGLLNQVEVNKSRKPIKKMINNLSLSLSLSL